MTTYADFDDLTVQNFLKWEEADTGVAPKEGSYYIQAPQTQVCYAYYDETFQTEKLRESDSYVWFWSRELPRDTTHIAILTNIDNTGTPLASAHAYGIRLTKTMTEHVDMFTANVVNGVLQAESETFNIDLETEGDVHGAWYKLRVQTSTLGTTVTLYDSDENLIVVNVFTTLGSDPGVNGFFVYNQDVTNPWNLLDNSSVDRYTFGG